MIDCVKRHGLSYNYIICPPWSCSRAEFMEEMQLESKEILAMDLIMLPVCYSLSCVPSCVAIATQRLTGSKRPKFNGLTYENIFNFFQH